MNFEKIVSKPMHQAKDTETGEKSLGAISPKGQKNSADPGQKKDAIIHSASSAQKLENDKHQKAFVDSKQLKTANLNAFATENVEKSLQAVENFNLGQGKDSFDKTEAKTTSHSESEGEISKSQSSENDFVDSKELKTANLNAFATENVEKSVQAVENFNLGQGMDSFDKTEGKITSHSESEGEISKSQSSENDFVEFERLINGKFKSVFNKKVQTIVEKRLKRSKELEATVEKLCLICSGDSSNLKALCDRVESLASVEKNQADNIEALTQNARKEGAYEAYLSLSTMGRRPSEGDSSHAASPKKRSVKEYSSEEILSLIKRAASGEKIKF